MCCSVLQCVPAECHDENRGNDHGETLSWLERVAACCNVLQCVAVCSPRGALCRHPCLLSAMTTIAGNRKRKITVLSISALRLPGFKCRRWYGVCAAMCVCGVSADVCMCGVCAGVCVFGMRAGVCVDGMCAAVCV